MSTAERAPDGTDPQDAIPHDAGLGVAELEEAAAALPPFRPETKQEGWVNEVATALAGLGLARRSQNVDTSGVPTTIPPEAFIALDGREAQLWVSLFASSEQARQAERGFMRTADQSTVSNGLLRVKAKGRLLFAAMGQRTDESRLDAVINAVGEVDLPRPQSSSDQ